jgi:putative membrane protein
MFILQFIRGMLMAMADSVPGVSGGTIAFILGFYDKFITSLNNIASKDKEKRNEAILFLAKLGVGWGFGFVLSVLFITSIFETHIYSISSIFLGLILGAIPIIVLQERETMKGKYHHLLFTLLGLTLVFSITHFNPIIRGGEGFVSNVDNLTLSIALFIVFAGIVSISAMVLPGISGSTILLIFGLYAPILNAVKEVLHFNLEYLPVVILLGIGNVLGIALIIKLVKLAIDHYRSATIYLIIGLMLGSVYAVILGPMTLEVPADALSFSTFSIFFFIVGVGFIIGLEQLRKYFEIKKEVDSE